jgi:type IV pilus assembly protein PilB
MFRAKGCSFCAHTGYSGRIALHEVMPVSEQIEALVVAHASASEIREVAKSQGMVPLRDDGLLKVLQGLTTIEEVLRVAV